MGVSCIPTMERKMDEINELVSILVVVRDEGNYIESCIDSILKQTYSNFEVIIVDGLSSDDTKQKALRALDNDKNSVKFKILDNQRKNLAAGWNLGINNCSGTFIVRLDAHAVIPKNFIERSVRKLTQIRKADNQIVAVGGKLGIQCKCNSFVGQAILNLYNSPFGVGNADYRFGRNQQLADTIVYGLYHKSVFEKVGFFNENLKRNQDLEFHGRLREKGYKLFFIPDITSTYFIREDIFKIVKKAFNDGFWCVRIFKYLSIRHITPFLFFLYILSLVFLSFLFQGTILILFLIPLIIYFLLLFYINFKNFLQNEYSALLSFFLFPALHLAYGCGTLFGFLKKIH